MRFQLQCPHFQPDLPRRNRRGDDEACYFNGRTRPSDRRCDELALVQGPRRPNRSGEAVLCVESRPSGAHHSSLAFPNRQIQYHRPRSWVRGFTGLVTACALALPKPDVVMGMSPPIFLGDSAWLVAKRHRVPFVFNVQDIFPDVAVESWSVDQPAGH